MSMLELLTKFAEYQGNSSFRPVHIGYQNMEKILEIRSLGNMNRQFVSLLKSEQETRAPPMVGDPTMWAQLFSPSAQLTTLDEAFQSTTERGGVVSIS